MDTTETVNPVAEQSPAPMADDAPQTPPVAEPTSRDAIDRAFAKLDEQETAKPVKNEAPEQPETPSEGPERGPDGRFKAKDTDTPEEPEKAADEAPEAPDATDQFGEAPSRFSANAKEAWKNAPVEVRAETNRALSELENGIQKYQQAFEPYRQFDQQIRQNGQTFEQVLNHYQGIESLLASDPMAGLDRICQNMGTSLREVASQVVGQTPDQATAQQESTIRGLQAKIVGLEQQLNGFSTSMQQREEAAITKQITEFQSQPGRERFDELSSDIAMLLEGGRATNLDEAYTMAERLNPAPVQPTPQAAPAAPEPAPAQTPKGQLSLSGAPSSGSNPKTRKKSASTREALDNAFAAVGMR